MLIKRSGKLNMTNGAVNNLLTETLVTNPLSQPRGMAEAKLLDARQN